MKNHTFKSIAPTIVLLSLVAFSADAAFKCPWYLRKKEYKDGDVVKSPMKVEPLLPRVVKNLMFKMGLIAKVERQIAERTPDFLNDFEYMSEKRYDNRLGKMATFFDHEFDTRVYHTVTAKVNSDGVVPAIDPDAKALFIYIHGSGTNKASGANFAYKGTELSKLGFAAMSFDLPYHMDGSMRKAYTTSDGFMKMLYDMVEKYRVKGMPVYLAGHSFGPEVVFEFVKRYPTSVDGVVGLSPAAFNKELNEWFMKATSQATDFWGDTKPNNLAGIWGGQATGEFQWNDPKSKLPDPTVVNPKLKVLALTGDYEEYAPGPMMPNGEPAKASRTYDICAALRMYMKNIYCVKEPEVGHYIFMRKDEHGNDAVLRELLRITKNSKEEMDAFPALMAKELKELRKEADSRKLSEIDKLAQRYVREPFFKEWMDRFSGGQNAIKKMVADNDVATATELMKTYNKVLLKRDQMMLKSNIFFMKKSNPKFYADNKELFDKTFNAKGELIGPGDVLIGKYFDFMSEMKTSKRKFNSVTDEVYNIPKEEKIVEVAKKGGEELALVDGKYTINTPSGKTLVFDPNVPPSEEEFRAAFALIGEMRDAKMFRESQPVMEWLKRWVSYKTNKQKQISEWAYTPEAVDFLKDIK